MRRGLPAALGAALVLAACTGSGTATSTQPDVTVTTTPPSTVAATTTAAAATTTPAVPPSTATTAATAPSTTTAAHPPCPDLSDGDGRDELAAFRDDGTRLWTAPLGSRGGGPFTLAGGTAFVGFGDGVVVALDVVTCAERWRIEGSGPVLHLTVDGDRLVVADTAQAGLVVAATGEPIWAVPWTPPGPASVTVAPDGLLVIADDTQLRAFDAEGEAVWQAPLPPGQFAGLVIGDDAVFAVSDASGVARELATGARRWTAPIDVAGPLPPAYEGGALYLTSTGTLLSIDPQDGTTRWRFEVPSGDAATGFLGPPRLDHNELHILDDAGRLHHLLRVDGSVVFTGRYPAGRTTPAFADRLVLTADDGTVTAENLLGRRRWSIATGADGLSRETFVSVDRDVILAYTADVGE